MGYFIRDIDYLFEIKIKHRDIKHANILINKRALVADLGVSKYVIDENTTASITANSD